MIYTFRCIACGQTHERVLPMAKRDAPQKCPKGHRMTRVPVMPGAVLWRGKFQGRWDKVEKGEW